MMQDWDMENQMSLSAIDLNVTLLVQNRQIAELRGSLNSLSGGPYFRFWLSRRLLGRRGIFVDVCRISRVVKRSEIWRTTTADIAVTIWRLQP